MSLEQSTYEKGWATCIDCGCRVRTESTVPAGDEKVRCRMRERCAGFKVEREAELAKWQGRKP